MADSDPRTELAEDRTVFAAERTYAAWVRTGLAALAAGIGGKTLLTGSLPVLGVKLVATTLTLFAVFCFAAAVWRELSGGPPSLKPDVKRIPAWLLYVVNTLLALAALMAVVSIWIK
jgi:putative membrane protein